MLLRPVSLFGRPEGTPGSSQDSTRLLLGVPQLGATGANDGWQLSIHTVLSRQIWMHDPNSSGWSRLCEEG